MSIRIIVDSASDILPEQAKQMDVDVLSIHTYFGQDEFVDGVTMSHKEFFEKLTASDVFPTTSQLTPYDYSEKFEALCKDGDEVICFTMSSKLSGCFQSATLAAQDFDGKVTVIDTLNACAGERILVEYAVRLRERGLSVEEIVKEIEEKREKVCLFALLDTLEYLKKSGRISATVAFAGNLLNVKPVIAIEQGEVNVLGKARGTKNGMSKLTQLIEGVNGIDFDFPYYFIYSGTVNTTLNNYVQANEALCGGNVANLPITMIGSTIGAHIGPGAIGVAFFAKDA